MNRNWNTYLPMVFVAAYAALLVAVPDTAFAALGNPGKNIGAWLYENVIEFFPPLLAVAGLWFLARREFTAFISFMVFAAVVALLVYFPTEIKTVAKALWDTAWGN